MKRNNIGLAGLAFLTGLAGGCASRIDYTGRYILDSRLIEVQNFDHHTAVDDYFSREEAGDIRERNIGNGRKAYASDLWKDRYLCDEDLSRVNRLEVTRDGQTIIKKDPSKANGRLTRIKQYIESVRTKK